MNIFRMLRYKNWPAVFGFSLFVGMMAAGYYCHLTYVQIGLEDFGSHRLGIDAQAVALSAWTATFLSTALAIFWQGPGWCWVGTFILPLITYAMMNVP